MLNNVYAAIEYEFIEHQWSYYKPTFWSNSKEQNILITCYTDLLINPATLTHIICRLNHVPPFIKEPSHLYHPLITSYSFHPGISIHEPTDNITRKKSKPFGSDMTKITCFTLHLLTTQFFNVLRCMRDKHPCFDECISILPTHWRP